MEKDNLIQEIAESHGFFLRDVRDLPEKHGRLYRMSYRKNGAELVWLDHEEENKTFAIAFKTIPSDDTGVFHILEHSVLCGSEKYPVKDPFVEMIKSSLQTFLNAFTYPDKTVYPVCSRNQQDFLNLMEVYLDAVFHPLCVTGSDVFRQEGWHYELEEPEGELICNGVVYNEMKGAYASPDTRMLSEMNRSLFPDNCYGFESGGDPEHIPDLTYEKYIENYRRFYHPSNARIFLDGTMDLDAVLAKLDAVLRDFSEEEPDAEIPMQQPVTPPERVGRYEIGRGESAEERTMLAWGWVCGRFDRPEENIALDILTEILCATNASPLKRALLETGLAQDVELYFQNGIQQPYLMLLVRNVREDQREQVFGKVTETLEKLVKDGLDHSQLEALLSRREFSAREEDYGNMPRGLMHAIHSLDSWLYGGDPAQNLSTASVFASLREKMEQGYFERMIREDILDNPHTARVVLIPSATLGEERDAAERQRLAKRKERWSPEQREQVVEEYRHLRSVQQEPEDPRQLAKLPTLSLKDIPEHQAEIPQEVSEVAGSTVLFQKIETDGILHLVYYFRVDDQPLETLHTISFLRLLLGQTPTERHSLLEMQSMMERELGRFETSVKVLAERDQVKSCVPYVLVNVSFLREKLPKAVEILKEIFLESRLSDLAYIKSRIRQLRLSLEQHVMMSGDSYAQKRISAAFSAKGVVMDAMEGIDMLRWVQDMDDHFEEKGQRLSAELEELMGKILTADRAALSITGDGNESDAEALLGFLRKGKMGEREVYQPRERGKEILEIPAAVGFAGKGGNLVTLGETFRGSLHVASRLLSYGYLWNDIRVQGGAYGTKLQVFPDGDILFTTYRDPNPARSLVSFDGAAQALRDFCDSGASVDKSIISAIAGTEPLRCAREMGKQEAEYYLSGVTCDMRRRVRGEILHTTPENLRQIADLLDCVCANGNSCVIGGERVLDGIADYDKKDVL